LAALICPAWAWEFHGLGPYLPRSEAHSLIRLSSNGRKVLGSFFIDGAEHAYVWSRGGRAEVIPTPPGYDRGSPAAISATGDRVLLLCAGRSAVVGSTTHWMWLPRYAEDVGTAGTGMSNDGSVVAGNLERPGLEPYRPFIYRDGAFQ